MLDVSNFMDVTMNGEELKNPKFEPVDTVNHPAHYQTENGLEAVDVIEAFTEGMNNIEAIHTGNTLKYLLRWKKKNGIEDLCKARWYLNRLIEHEKKG